MSQVVFANIDPNTKSGTQLAADLNDFKSALLTQHSGATSPTYVEIGTEWLDTSVAGILVFKKYDGTQFVSTFTIDDVAHTLSLGGNNPTASVTITRSDTAADMIEMFRNTAVQTEGGLIFTQINDNAIKKTMGKIKINSESVADTAEDASVSFEVMDAGTLTEIFKVDDSTMFVEAFKGIGQRNIVVDANGNVSTEAASSGANIFSDGNAVTGDDTNYTATTLTFTKSATAIELIDGTQVYKAVATGAAETLETAAITIPVGYIDQPLIVSMKYKASADWTIEMIDQGATTLVTETIEAFTPISNEASVKKLFAVLPSGTTSVTVKLTSTAADTLLFDDLEVYSSVAVDEPLYFSRSIDNNVTNTDLFLIASLKASAYRVQAKITRETTTNFAQAISEFFINYSSDASAWSVKKEVVTDFETVDTELTFDMNVRTLNYDSSDITGASYTGNIRGTITRIL
jgi:hypothetical protein